MKRLALLPLALTLSACINDDLVLDEIELRGSIVVEPDMSDMGGTIHLEFHHAFSGSGELEHPLGLIERSELEPGARELDHTLLVPRDEGEGLVVYAWLDRDGDGILCGLEGDAAEPAGAITLDYPPYTLEFELTLDQPCAGPELAMR
jgi:hypothetical protein